MKKALSLIVLTVSLFLFGCAKNVSPSTGDSTGNALTTTGDIQQNLPKRQTYQNKTDGFSLQFPGDRTFQEKVYGASVMFSSPISETDKIKENVSIAKKPLSKDSTLEEQYTLLKEVLTKQADYLEVENSSIKVNDIDAKKTIFKSSLNSTKLQFEQVLLIKDKALYIFTYTATEATFGDYIQKVNEMVATLEIK
jgi:hypothetical protein